MNFCYSSDYGDTQDPLHDRSRQILTAAGYIDTGNVGTISRVFQPGEKPPEDTLLVQKVKVIFDSRGLEY